MRVCLIVNPQAGRRRGLIAAARAEAELTRAGWTVDRRLTTAPGQAAALARQAAEEGFEAVLACGGDGTLSQVVTGLLDSGVPAGLIPAGTSNDFARTLGLSRDPAGAARELVFGRVVPVDLLEVNRGELWALNVMGVGFDAAVSERMNRRRRLTAGLVANLSAVGQELISYRPVQVELAVDGVRWQGEVLLAAVANAQSYGAGMRIAPQARINDGLLDVVVVERLSRWQFLRSFPLVLRGAHLGHPAVRTWRGRQVTLHAAAPLPVLVDGDVQSRCPVQVQVAPARARLLVPPRWR